MDAAGIGGAGRACAVALAFEVGLCAGCGILEKAVAPILIPGSALGTAAKERLPGLTDCMSNREEES